MSFCSYPVYFECPELLPGHRSKVERYFKISRKSGGGDCELRGISQGAYSVSFRNKKDQSEVLRRARHLVDVGDTRLEFTVTEEPAPRDRTDNMCNPGASLPPSGEEQELQLCTSLSEILKEEKEPLLQTASTELNPRRIVLLGKTGSGKSSLGNIIFGEEVFQPDHTPNSGTGKCQAETRTVNGRNITLIDTPGFFDTGRSEEELKPEILDCLIHCAPGPHAFLIVLQVEKFTEQEEAVIEEICNCFSQEAFKYAVVAFTHGDDLPEDVNIQTFIQDSARLSDLVQKCGNRYHVFDCKYWGGRQTDRYRSNQFQVEELLKTTDKMEDCYRNEVFEAVGEDIAKEEEIIKQTSKNMPPDQIRAEAKKRVSRRWVNSLAGIAVGTLLGAVFGVEMLARSVFKALRCPGVIPGVQVAVRAASAAGVALTGELGLAVGAATVGLAAVAGGVAGGMYGGRAVEGAESVQDAVDRAVKAVKDQRERALTYLSDDK